MTVLEDMEKSIQELKAIIPEPQPLLIKIRPEYFDQIKDEFTDLQECQSLSSSKFKIWKSPSTDTTFCVTEDAPKGEILVIKLPVTSPFKNGFSLWAHSDQILKEECGIK